MATATAAHRCVHGGATAARRGVHGGGLLWCFTLLCQRCGVRLIYSEWESGSVLHKPTQDLVDHHRSTQDLVYAHRPT